jgi:hypothetical protein
MLQRYYPHATGLRNIPEIFRQFDKILPFSCESFLVDHGPPPLYTLPGDTVTLLDTKTPGCLPGP